MALVTLAEHNAAVAVQNSRPATPRANNIKCPLCEAELLDTVGEAILATFPPQYPIHCGVTNCAYRGHRS